METVKADGWCRQLTPENRRKADGMVNLLLEAQRKNYDSDEQFKRIIVRANGAEYIAFAAIICNGVGQDGADIVEGYSRQSFKRAVKWLRGCQRQYPDYATHYEDGIRHIRRVWLHKEEPAGQEDEVTA